MKIESFASKLLRADTHPLVNQANTPFVFSRETTGQ
jgi:hypothetical protein